MRGLLPLCRLFPKAFHPSLPRILLLLCKRISLPQHWQPPLRRIPHPPTPPLVPLQVRSHLESQGVDARTRCVTNYRQPNQKTLNQIKHSEHPVSNAAAVNTRSLLMSRAHAAPQTNWQVYWSSHFDFGVSGVFRHAVKSLTSHLTACTTSS